MSAAIQIVKPIKFDQISENRKSIEITVENGFGCTSK